MAVVVPTQKMHVSVMVSSSLKQSFMRCSHHMVLSIFIMQELILRPGNARLKKGLREDLCETRYSLVLTRNLFQLHHLV